MIDDHPIILEGYTKVLSTINKFDLNITKVYTCDTAVAAINKAKFNRGFDIVFIDIQLPPSKDGTIISGEDLALLVDKELPNTYIIILTMFDNPHRLYNILNTIPHHGLLNKSDMTSKLLIEAFEAILNGNFYYSKSVQKVRKKFLLNDEFLDETNKKIIYHLSTGVKTKNLPNYISLSLSAIEKRKSYIKQLFNVKGDDEELLNKARERGFI